MPKIKPRRFALSAAYIEEIHDYLVSELMPGDEPVGPHEPRDQGLLSSAAARPFQSAFGEEPYKTIFEKAAVLFHSLIANHPFHNGNKRTAVIALDHFLTANGWVLALTNPRMYQLAIDTARYRERGITHEDILIGLVKEIKTNIVSYRWLKQLPGSTQLYELLKINRNSIRKHPLNRVQPGND